MKSIDNIEIIGLGALVPRQEKTQKNYVKRGPDTLREGLSIDSNGMMSFNPPYIEVIEKKETISTGPFKVGEKLYIDARNFASSKETKIKYHNTVIIVHRIFDDYVLFDDGHFRVKSYFLSRTPIEQEML